MKTVNLTIDEATWRAARRLAAERDTSVSALVREALAHLTRNDRRRERARREILRQIGTLGGRWAERHGIHPYDAAILAAAMELGASRVLSEDLSHGQEYDGVRVINPFRGSD